MMHIPELARRLAAILLAICILLTASVGSHADQPLILMPIGGGYTNTYEGFLQVALARAQNRTVSVLLLPIGYAEDPENVSSEDRIALDEAAEIRRAEIESTCRVMVRNRLTCNVQTVPIYTRADALDPHAVDAFTDDLTAVYIPGGDQGVAMRVVQDTPIEAALERVYRNGTLIVGTSAGCAIQSQTMIAGYATEDLGPENGLEEGALDIWRGPERRGLAFGLRDAILDQHFFQRNRLPRLLNAIARPGLPHVGIGVDAYTGVQVHDGTSLERVFGLYTAAVLDAQTYHGHESAAYGGPHRTLGIRNVLVHLLAPGQTKYDLLTRTHSLAPPARTLTRRFDALKPPPGAGPLILSGGLRHPEDGGPILNLFMSYARGNPTDLLFVTSAYTSTELANELVDRYIDGINITNPELIWSVVFAGGEEPVPYDVPPEITGIVLTGDDASLIEPGRLAPVKAAWRRGVPVLADDAPAAALGAYFAPVPPSDRDAGSLEVITQGSFLDGNVTPIPGLGLLDIVLEPRMLDDNRWGRLFSLLYHHPSQLGLALPAETAVAIGPDGAAVVGENGVFVLDTRTAHMALGSNEGYVIANGLLDVFGSGERLVAVPARSGYVITLPLSLDRHSWSELDAPLDR